MGSQDTMPEPDPIMVRLTVTTMVAVPGLVVSDAVAMRAASFDIRRLLERNGYTPDIKAEVVK
jgi:hypothetical protein